MIEVLQIIIVRHTCTFCIEPTCSSETRFVTGGPELIYIQVFEKHFSLHQNQLELGPYMYMIVVTRFYIAWSSGVAVGSLGPTACPPAVWKNN
jgi:hypothetical protein